MLRTDFHPEVQSSGRAYGDTLGRNPLRETGLAEQAIKVVAVAATVFVVFAALLTADPVALFVVTPITLIGCIIVIKCAHLIFEALSSLVETLATPQSSHQRSHHKINPETWVFSPHQPLPDDFAGRFPPPDAPRANNGTPPPYSATLGQATASAAGWAGGPAQVTVGGGHAPTHTTASAAGWAGGPAQVTVGGGHAPTHTTASAAGGPARVAVGGGHAPTHITASAAGGPARVAVGGGHDPRQTTPDGRVPIGQRRT